MVVDLLELKARLPAGGRLLGLDVGTKTIGLALSDSGLTVAAPLATLQRGKFAADVVRLTGIVSERGIAGFVIGLPVGMDGREGPRCQSVRQFAANLQARLDLPTAFWDERFSTLAVERSLREAEMSHRRRAVVVDKLAAAYILQGALDRIARGSAPA